MRKTFLLFILFHALHSISAAQVVAAPATMYAIYDIKKNVLYTDPADGRSKQLAIVAMEGHLYRYGSRYYSYCRPLYLEQYPMGEIEYPIDFSHRGVVILDPDTVQQLNYSNFDTSMRWKSQDGGNDGAGQVYKSRYREPHVWQIMPDTQSIQGLRCQRARKYRNNDFTGELLWEVWFVADIQMQGGPDGMAFTPGLVVEGTNFVSNQTYRLRNYEKGVPIPTSFRAIHFFDDVAPKLPKP